VSVVGAGSDAGENPVEATKVIAEAVSRVPWRVDPTSGPGSPSRFALPLSRYPLSDASEPRL
jgi:hypothetical protein